MRLWKTWACHNLVAHPLSEILFHLGAVKLSHRVHDSSIPEHETGEGRG